MDREPTRSFEDLIAWQKAHANPWRVRSQASAVTLGALYLLPPTSYLLT